MSRTRAVGFAVVIGILPGSSSLAAQVAPSRVTSYLEQIRQETRAPGLAVAVSMNGTTVFSGGVGYAELENLTPASAGTVLNVGSVAKVMTTVAIMQLLEQGKLSLDDPIRKYMPAFPDKGTPVTLSQILTHTSGIRHYKDGEFGPYDLLEMRHYDSIQQAIAIFKDDPLLFKPGQGWSYSSHAYNLLQGVVEGAAGKGFEAYMREHVWGPAGMQKTAFEVPARIVPRRGRGYVRNAQDSLVNIRFLDVSYKYASGGMLSNVEDLVRLAVALNNGVLLKPASMSRMYSVQVDPVMGFQASSPAVRQTFKQAIGWRVEADAKGREYVFHTGTGAGTRSVLINYPRERLVVALLTNALPFDSQKYGSAIAQLFLPAP